MILFEQNKNGNYVAKVENGKYITKKVDGKSLIVEFLSVKEDNSFKGYYTAQEAVFDNENNKYVAGNYYLLSSTGKKLCEFSKDCKLPCVYSFIYGLTHANKETFMKNIKSIKDSHFLADENVEKSIIEMREGLWFVISQATNVDIDNKTKIKEEWKAEYCEIKKVFNNRRQHNKVSAMCAKANCKDFDK